MNSRLATLTISTRQIKLIMSESLGLYFSNLAIPGAASNYDSRLEE